MFKLWRQSRCGISLPRPLLLALLAAAWPAGAAELRLLMFEQPGCLYCARWDAEIAPQYPLTDEGRAAPVQRLQMRDPLPRAWNLPGP